MTRRKEEGERERSRQEQGAGDRADKRYRRARAKNTFDPTP
jgi:hypothetical protein